MVTLDGVNCSSWHLRYITFLGLPGAAAAIPQDVDAVNITVIMKSIQHTS